MNERERQINLKIDLQNLIAAYEAESGFIIFREIRMVRGGDGFGNELYGIEFSTSVNPDWQDPKENE